MVNGALNSLLSARHVAEKAVISASDDTGSGVNTVVSGASVVMLCTPSNQESRKTPKMSLFGC